MWYLATFLLGGAAAVLLTWLWGFMTGQSHGAIVQALDEYKAAGENQKLLEEFTRSGFPEMDRRAIWRRIAWIWNFTRLVALRSARLGAVAWLALFGLACIGLIFKTALLPNSHDLRILIGGNELITFYAAGGEES